MFSHLWENMPSFPQTTVLKLVRLAERFARKMASNACARLEKCILIDS